MDNLTYTMEEEGRTFESAFIPPFDRLSGVDAETLEQQLNEQLVKNQKWLLSQLPADLAKCVRVVPLYGECFRHGNCIMVVLETESRIWNKVGKRFLPYRIPLFYYAPESHLIFADSYTDWHCSLGKEPYHPRHVSKLFRRFFRGRTTPRESLSGLLNTKELECLMKK